MKGERMRKITEELRNCKERCDDIPRLVGKHLKIRTERGSIRDDAPLRGMVEHLSMEECSIGSLYDGGLLPTDILGLRFRRLHHWCAYELPNAAV